MEQKKIRPLGNRVLIKRSSPILKKGKILLLENTNEKPCQGEVIAVGDGGLDKKGERIPLPVKIGDQVLYSTYGGNEIPLDGNEDYLILSQEDILAIVVN